MCVCNANQYDGVGRIQICTHDEQLAKDLIAMLKTSLKADEDDQTTYEGKIDVCISLER